MIDEERPDAPGEGPEEEAAAGAGQEPAGDAGEAPTEAEPAGAEAADAEAAEEEAAAAPEAAAQPEAAAPEDAAAPEVAAAPEDVAEPEAPAEAQAAASPDETPASGAGAVTPEGEEQALEASAAAPGGAEEPPAPAGAFGGQPEIAERPRDRRGRRPEGADEAPPEEAIPGAHLEPDLVLEETQPEAETEFAEYAEPEVVAEPAADAPAPADAPVEEAVEQPAPAARSPRDLAADARYRATGKRKTSVARVVVRPGDGAYTVNGRALEDYFPRAALRKAARQPLESAGYETRMDVVARLHGGGVSAQAGALRHGLARALVEADPHLRGELKRRGFLTRDARAKERKKAGLKKARKRPQFSKR